jgi:hypothetical protein
MALHCNFGQIIVESNYPAVTQIPGREYMFIGWNEKTGSIPVGNVCYFARFYIKSLRDLGNLPYSPYKHIFPTGIFWWRLDSYEIQANKPQNNLLQAFYNLLHLKSHG